MFLEDGLFSFNNSNNRTKHFFKKNNPIGYTIIQDKDYWIGRPGDLEFLCWLNKIPSMTLGKSQHFPVAMASEMID